MIADHYYRKAHVTHVIDGDTFEAVVDLGFYVSISQRFRILDINAPEIKGKDKALGLESKKFLQDLIEDKDVIIHSTKLDGFRRSLCHVYITIDDMIYNVATLLIKQGFADKKIY